jgi:hypothetical protein
MNGHVDEATTAKDPMDFADDLAGFEDVLEHRLDEDGIDALVGERDVMGVGDELRERAAVDVESDDPRPAVLVDGIDAVAQRPAADDEHERRRSGKEGQQQLDVARRCRVERIPQGSQPHRELIDRPAVGARVRDRAGALRRSKLALVHDGSLEIDERGRAPDHGEAPWCGEGARLRSASKADIGLDEPASATRASQQRCERSTNPIGVYPHPLNVPRTG